MPRWSWSVSSWLLVLVVAGDLLLGDREGVVGGRHAEVDGRLQEDLLDLLDGQAVSSGGAHVHGELVPVVAGDERGQGDRAAHPPVETGTGPHLAPGVAGDEVLERLRERRRSRL